LPYYDEWRIRRELDGTKEIQLGRAETFTLRIQLAFALEEAFDLDKQNGRGWKRVEKHGVPETEPQLRAFERSNSPYMELARAFCWTYAGQGQDHTNKDTLGAKLISEKPVPGKYDTFREFGDATQDPSYLFGGDGKYGYLTDKGNTLVQQELFARAKGNELGWDRRTGEMPLRYENPQVRFVRIHREKLHAVDQILSKIQSNADRMKMHTRLRDEMWAAMEKANGNTWTIKRALTALDDCDTLQSNGTRILTPHAQAKVLPNVNDLKADLKDASDRYSRARQKAADAAKELEHAKTSGAPKDK
jgi:hypothetical protein